MGLVAVVAAAAASFAVIMSSRGLLSSANRLDNLGSDMGSRDGRQNQHTTNPHTRNQLQHGRLTHKSKFLSQQEKRRRACDHCHPHSRARNFKVPAPPRVRQCNRDSCIAFSEGFKFEGEVGGEAPEGEGLEDEGDTEDDDGRHVEADGGVAADVTEKVEEEGLVQVFQQVVQTPDCRLHQTKKRS